MALAGRPVLPAIVPAALLGPCPSGPVAPGMLCTGPLAVLFARRHAPYRRGLALAVAGWTTLVAWSLLWLQYHWFTDVLGGALLGALLLWLLYRWPWYLVATKAPVQGHRLGDWVPRLGRAST